jgi:hypothetical protein
MMAAIFVSDSAKIPGLISEVGVELSSPDKVLGAGIGLSPSSRMDDSMRSCTNTPTGGAICG